MGIVVSLAMLLGVVFLSSSYFYLIHRESVSVRIGVAFLVSTGLWNSVWYGMQNSQTFWGIAAFVSGVFILLSAIVVHKKGLTEMSANHSTQHLIRMLIIVGLALCFALYVVTIIRINLELPIIR